MVLDRRTFLGSVLAAPLSLGSQDKAKWRVAVIGHTKRGDYGHGLDTMWQRLPETELVAVADADETGLAKALAKLKLDKGFRDYKAMLKETKPDLVAVAPRHVDQHAEMILAAVEAGAKGIYVEKPFCRTPHEADEILAAMAKTNAKLAVAHRNRWHPVLPVIKKLIADGVIGTVIELRGRGKEDHRGGALDLWVLGSHVFNLGCYFAGTPKSCSASLLKGDQLVTKTDLIEGAEGVGLIGGDAVHARFEMAGGVPFFFDSIAKAGVSAAGFGLQIVGNKGIIDLRVDVEPLANLLSGNPFQMLREPRAWVPISTAGIGRPEPLEKLGDEVASHSLAARDLLASTKENRAPLCDAKEAAMTVEMISAVLLSHRLNAARIDLPLASRGHPLVNW